MAESGDTLDDANFDSKFANDAILKLTNLENWFEEKIKAAIPKGKVDFK